MSKYSFELKLEVVEDYLGGETRGYESIAKKYSIVNFNQVKDWVKNYEKYGEENYRIYKLV